MRVGLLGAFDIGVTYGFGDQVFKPDAATGLQASILNVGLRNPLGQGHTFRLDQEDSTVVPDWTSRAVRLVDSKEMDHDVLGFVPSEAERTLNDYKAELARRIREHPVARVELTIHAIGVVLLYLEFAPGVPTRYARGFQRCYEFAAYEPPVSNALLAAARAVARRALDRDGQADQAVRRLTARPPAETETDREGRVESRLFTGFSRTAFCVDPGDDDAAAVARALFLSAEAQADPTAAATPFEYEYHGTLHYDWGGCVLAPRRSTAAANAADLARGDVARMWEGVRIAHLFLGTCQAFERLFLAQTVLQAETLLLGGTPGLSSRDLNRLRTLALAVVSLTNFAPVTEAGEDQSYFKRFETDGELTARRALLQSRCEVLYNVQTAEAQAEEKERKADEDARQRRLGWVVLVLTGLTLMSILADSYNFVKDDEKHLVPELGSRFWLVVGVGLSIVTAVVTLALVLTPRRRKRE